MTKTIEHLLQNSHLPGPRGNLELMFSFMKSASAEEVNECLSYDDENLKNSPEEFVMMCGITGYSYLHRNNPAEAAGFIRKFASHKSWRVREAVAMGIQCIVEGREMETLAFLENWAEGNELEKRALAAGFCEPSLLNNSNETVKILKILEKMTMDFLKNEGKLSEDQEVLRKGLGYCWSVAVSAFPGEGKMAMEKIAGYPNRHIRWIIKENLKKNRLVRMDKKWVDRMLNKIMEDNI